MIYSEHVMTSETRMVDGRKSLLNMMFWKMATTMISKFQSPFIVRNTIFPIIFVST